MKSAEIEPTTKIKKKQKNMPFDKKKSSTLDMDRRQKDRLPTHCCHLLLVDLVGSY